MTAERSAATEEAPITTLIDTYASALRSKNAALTIALHTDDVVLFVMAPPLQLKGAAAAERKLNLEKWFSSFSGDIGYTVTDLDIVTGEDVAYCHSLNHMSGTKAAGDKVDLWFRNSMGFRKVLGEWKIAHEHQSVPFYMDGSVKAAVDLKP